MLVSHAGTSTWWDRRHVATKALLVAAAFWLAIVLILGQAGSSLGGAAVAGAPASTAPNGFAALVSLLEENGHKVISDPRPLVGVDPAGGGTLLITDRVLSAAENREMAMLVRSGWLLVVVGGDSLETLRPLIGSSISFVSGGSTTSFASHLGSAGPGVHSVTTDGLGTFTNIGHATALLGSPGEILAATAIVGNGRVDFIADSSVFENAHLADADNAAFALNVFGRPGARVTVSAANETSGSGLGVLPGSWRVALLILLVSWFVWVSARGKRLGPPDAVDERVVAPARRSYVDSLATLLARAKDPAPVGTELNELVRRRLAREDGTALVGVDDFSRALRRAGLSEEEAAMTLITVRSEDDLVALTRATQPLRARS